LSASWVIEHTDAVPRKLANAATRFEHRRAFVRRLEGRHVAEQPLRMYIFSS
jgi:hypothetical protein